MEGLSRRDFLKLSGLSLGGFAFAPPGSLPTLQRLGVGRVTARQICRKCNIDPIINIDALDEPQIFQIRELVEREYKVEGDLRRDVAQNIKRLMDLGCYRGLRHRKGLHIGPPSC